jgi:4-nitrophenyl phosphatase
LSKYEMPPRAQSAGRRIDFESICRLRPTAVLLDFDGTLMVGHELVPGADQLIEAFAGRCAVITNNSSDTPAELARRLSRSGVHFPKDMVFTAGALLVEKVAREAGASPVLAILSPAMRRFAQSLGITLCDGTAPVVAIGRDPAFDYRKLTSAANSIRRGARAIAANADGSHPGPHGTIIPETGSILAAISAAVGDTLEPEILGKPARHLADAALSHLGLAAAARVVVVGDNRQTDGTLAESIGALYYHVESANHFQFAAS